MKIMPRILFAIFSGLACPITYGEDTLCSGNERIVFSCHIGEKIVSLCRPGDKTQALIYRFGRLGEVELSFPDSSGKGGFRASTSPLYGGGTTAVAFLRGEYEYRLYSKVGRGETDASSGDREPVFEDGLIVSKAGNPVMQLICDDGGEGFREDIRWLSSTQ